MLSCSRRSAGLRLLYLRRPFCSSGFDGLPLHSHVIGALGESGFTTPSKIQRLGVQAMFKKIPQQREAEEVEPIEAAYQTHVHMNDVVIGAETGSGKTLSYLAPIVSSLLHSGSHKSTALVLCPNNILCEQVAGVAQTIFARKSKSIDSQLRVRTVRQGMLHEVRIDPARLLAEGEDSYEVPDDKQPGPMVVVSTPAAFLNLVEACDQVGHRLQHYSCNAKLCFTSSAVMLCIVYLIYCCRATSGIS
jgi:superfamily II DNA/RNA helicase